MDTYTIDIKENDYDMGPGWRFRVYDKMGRLKTYGYFKGGRPHFQADSWAGLYKMVQLGYKNARTVG